MQSCHKHSVCKNAIPGEYNKVKDNNMRHAKARKSYAIHDYIQRQGMINRTTGQQQKQNQRQLLIQVGGILAYKFHSLNNFLWSSY